jgi:hypothetical protein
MVEALFPYFLVPIHVHHPGLFPLPPAQLFEQEALIGLAKQNRHGSRNTDIHQAAVNVKGIQVVLQRFSH